ncbi:ComF family protein [Streptomyces pseudovenezuelae]|nr:ComF family protein [Streptomyces pseudovenezuelae]
MRGWWRDLTDLVLPAECGGCGKPRTVLCPECRAALYGAVPGRVRPVPEPPGLPVVHAAARYADAVRAALLAHKERGALGLAGPLGTALAGAVSASVREVCESAGEGSAWGRSRGAWERGYGALAGDGGELEGGPAGRVTVGLDGAEVSGAGAAVLAGGQDAAGAAVLADGRDAAGVEALRGGGCAFPVNAGVSPLDAPRAARVSASGTPLPPVPVLLVPVPSARRAVRARGHDPARRIALAAAGELRRAGMPARVVAVLRQQRWVADQSGLNSRQRLDNLAGALTVVPGGGRLLAEGLVVLVDDLMTTGASLTEAARAVQEARARENRAAVALEDLARRGERTTAGHRDHRQQGRGERGGPRSPGTESLSGDRPPGTVGRRVRGEPGKDGCHDERRQDGSGRRGGRVVAGCRDDPADLVYTAATREGMGERTAAVTEEGTDRERCVATTAGAGGVRDVVCAAVVAAPPDSFEINRN